MKDLLEKLAKVEEEIHSAIKERDDLALMVHSQGNTIQRTESWLKLRHPRVFKEMKKEI